MPSSSQSFNRVGGEVPLGPDASLLAAAVLTGERFAALTPAADASALQFRLLDGQGAALAAVDFTAGPAGAAFVRPEVTALAGGGAVVTWLSAYSHGPQAHYAVIGAAGQLLANATLPAASAASIDAIALPDGGFDLALAQTDFSGQHASLTLQAFDASGGASGAAADVDAGGQGYSGLQGVLTASGPQLFWADPSGVHAALVGADGAVHEAEVAAGAAGALQALRLDDGRVALAWSAADGAGSDVLTAVIDPASGAASAAAVVASGAGASVADQRLGLAALEGGGYAVSWRPDGSGEASAAAVGPDGQVGPAAAGVGDLIGAGASGELYAVSRHDGGAWIDGYDWSGPDGDPAPVAAGPAPGRTIAAPDDSGTVLAGGAGDDVLIASHGADTLTGGGGADAFTFRVVPWSAGHVTDFAVGTDTLDLSALFRDAGYGGADPVGDGYLSFSDDGAGGTRVWFDPDSHGSGTPWPYLITNLDGVAPSSLQVGRDVVVSDSAGGDPPGGGSGDAGSGGAVAQSGAAQGQTLAAPDDSGTVLAGGAGDDVLIASHGADVLTGAGGADVFTFPVLPWSAGHVTDFTPGADVLDLRPLFQAAGYGGSDPVADGYLSFSDDGAGGTRVWFDPDGPGSGTPWPFLITDLDHVSPSALQPGHDWLFQ